MTDRTVKVSLIAQVNGYLAGMQQAQKATQATASEADKLAAKKQAFQDLGRTLTAIGAVAAAAVGIAIKKFADFDAQMSQVKALSHATGDEMKKLSDAALTMGQGIGFSASQVADAETELVKAGISVKDILGGALPGALTLAAAGQIDVAQATEIATIAMTQFGLKGKDIPHVADLLSAGADKALGGVSDLGEALKSGGLVAAQFGVSLDETVGTLSAFANAGLLGETAGTDLRQMLLKLGNPAADAAKTMKDLGINIYDAQGQFVGMSALAGQLHDKMKDLDPATRNAALATIFGSRAIAGANVLYKEGAKGITGWTKAVNDQGFAAHQASAKMDNLEGDIKKLGAALDNDLIKAGGSANGILRGLAQETTTLISAISNVPAPLLAVGLGITALVAGVGLLGGGFLMIVPRIAATRAALADLNLTGASVAKGFGKGGAILLAITAIASAFTNMSSTSELSADGLAKVDDVMNNLSKKNLNNLFKDAGIQMVDSTKKSDKFKESLNNLASGNFFENGAGAPKFIDGLTFGLTHLGDVYKDNEARFKAMGQTLGETAKTDFPKASDAFRKIADAAGGGKEAIRQLLTEMPDYKASLIGLASAQGITLTQSQLFNLAVGKGQIAQQLSVGTTAQNAKALATLSGQADDTTGSISDLTDAINNFGKGALDTQSASVAFQQAIDDMTDSIDKNGQTLDINTQEGRDNDIALRNIATSALGLAAAQATAGASQDTLTATMATGRQAFIDAATAAGLTADQANALATQYGLVPANVTTAVGVTGVDQTSATVQGWINKLNEIPGSVLTTIGVSVTGLPNAFVQGPAEGGTIYKAGGGRVPRYSRSLVNMFKPIGTDTVPAMLTPGEEVINARQAQKHRPLLKAINAGTMGFAYGGSVPPTYVPAPQQYATTASSSAPAGLRPITNNIYDARDPVGTAQAVARRQQLLGA